MSCKNIINGGGCVPGPNFTHAFITYTEFQSSGSATAEVFRVELNNTLNAQITHLIQGQTGFSGQSIISSPSLIYFLSDSGGKTVKNLYSIGYDGTGMKRALPFNYEIYSANFVSGLPFILILYNGCPSCDRAQGINSPFGIYNTLFSTFTSLGTAYTHADLSKDGKTIFFDYMGTNGVPHIYSIKTDGTGLTQLTNTPYGEEYPALSPDGSTLAIASFMDSGHNEEEICFMNPDGTQIRQITKLSSTTVAHQPCWSPVGDQIFFSLFDRASTSIPSHIYSSALDGSNIQKFTSGNGETFPSAGYMNEF
jgi:hypothetical protein